MIYGYADVLNDGRAVVAAWEQPTVYFGDVAVPSPGWLLFLRACLGPWDNKAYAVGKRQSDGRAVLVCEDGRTLVLGPTAGNQCVVIVPTTNSLLVTVQTSATEATIYTIDPASLLVWSRTLAIPETSQGFYAAESDGTPILTDPPFRTLAGRNVGYVCTWPTIDVTIAQDNKTGHPVLARGAGLVELAIGDAFEPHVSQNGRYWVCRSVDPVMFSGVVPDVIPEPIVEPIHMPTFSFNHPVLVAPFKDPDDKTGAPAEIIVNRSANDNPPQQQTVKRPYFVAEDSIHGSFKGERLGIYSEAADPTNVVALAKTYGTRVLLGYDARLQSADHLARWRDNFRQWVRLMAAALPAWAIPAFELYFPEVRGLETLEQTVARWRQDARDLLAGWPGDCGVIPQWYCRGGAPPDEIYTEQEVLDGLGYLSEIVNLSERIKVIDPFAINRLNGAAGHPVLMQAAHDLVAAGELAGLATLTPVGAPIGTSTMTLEQATILNSPADLASWPITTTITAVRWDANGVHVEFSKRDGPGRWPDVRPPGWDGDLQYTLGACLLVAGRWYASAVIQFWHEREADGVAPSDFAVDWFYNPPDPRWGPMGGHQPHEGEVVGFFVAAGDCRNNTRGDLSPVKERSNVVMIAFPPAAGGAWTFDAAPPPLPQPEPPPLPPPPEGEVDVKITRGLIVPATYAIAPEGEIIPHPNIANKVALHLRTGRWFTVTPDGAPAYDRESPWNWEAFDQITPNVLRAEREGGRVYMILVAGE